MISYRRITALVLGTVMLAGLAAWIFKTAPIDDMLSTLFMGPALAELPANRVAAQDFPKGFVWLNTDHPLSLEGDLKGQVVVLDFWTYCCINCIHNLATLEKVEEHYRDETVTIIGVHSNKFTNEGEAAHIREAILRYGIRHPVIVDQHGALWNAYDVRAWPTLVFIDAQGQIVGSLSGENPPQRLISIIDQILAEGRAQGVLAKGPLRLKRMKMPESTVGGLAFPGKIVAGPDGRLFIADSNHNRIVVVRPDGPESTDAAVVQIIGSGQAGSRDGARDVAQFDNPQGIALDAAYDVLYVADTDNHLIRRVDLASGEVTTILGTGAQVYDARGGGKGTAQGLNSPWDLALDGDTLYIAMAGEHQIWRMDLKSSVARAWLGSSGEGIIDGGGERAELAQPSGLSIMGGDLYFMDSETSSLRRASLDGGKVETLIGKGLFVYGDVDGDFDQARLQHPLGVTNDGKEIYIADTYNHKIKVADPVVRRIETLAGTGESGAGEPGGVLQLNEPGGLAWTAGRLFVADTTNHRIVVLDPAGGGWSVLKIDFPKAGAAEKRGPVAIFDR